MRASGRRLAARSFGAVAAVVCVASGPRASAAPPDDSLGEALGAGAATAVVPFVTGAMLVASSHDTAVKDMGVVVAQLGLVAAPFVAHTVVGESARGARLSLLPLAGAACTLVVVATRPRFLDDP